MESLEKIILKFCAGAAVFVLFFFWIDRAYAQSVPPVGSSERTNAICFRGAGFPPNTCSGAGVYSQGEVYNCGTPAEPKDCVRHQSLCPTTYMGLPFLYSSDSGQVCHYRSCPDGHTPDGSGMCSPPPPDECPPPNVMRPLPDGNSICTAPCPANQEWSQELGSCTNSCPDGQEKDANGICTSCPAGTVKNVLGGGACEPQAECEFPQKYDAWTNACSANPYNCAIGASYNVIYEQCMAFNDTSCPDGWEFPGGGSTGLHCVPAGGGASSEGQTSSGGQTSSTPTSSPSSSGQTSSTPIKPPTYEGDNTDPNQDTSNSRDIPAGSGDPELSACEKVFGRGNCYGIATGTCPNGYTINGQKLCVKNTSPQVGEFDKPAGDCDPTDKNYAKCVGLLVSVDEALSGQLIDGAIGELEAAMDGAFGEVVSDVEGFQLPGEFSERVNPFVTAVKGFLPDTQPCVPLELSLLGTSKAFSCEPFQNFRLIFGWFLTILAAVYMWSMLSAPVNR